MSRRVLVTGGSGFVGANLVRRLIRDGHDVHLLLRAQHDPWRITELATDYRTHIADLEDGNRVRRVVQDVRPGLIFHLAVHGAYPHQTSTAPIFAANVIGTANLLDACTDVGFAAFINAGSSSEYGPKGHAPSEDESLDPIHTYAVAKAAATMYCRQVARTRGVHIVTLRMYSVYGPWEAPARLMPTLLRSALQCQWPKLVSADAAHDYVYVDDVVDAFIAAAENTNVARGSIYNVGTGKQSTMGELVEIVRELVPIEEDPIFGSMPNRQWDTSTWIANIERIRRELGWEPRTSLQQGLQQMLQWVREYPFES